MYKPMTMLAVSRDGRPQLSCNLKHAIQIRENIAKNPRASSGICPRNSASAFAKVLSTDASPQIRTVSRTVNVVRLNVG